MFTPSGDSARAVSAEKFGLGALEGGDYTWRGLSSRDEVLTGA